MRRRSMWIRLFAAAALLPAALVQAAQSFESPPQQVALLELFTSEGCSSCPPADAWLSTLVRDPRLWQTLVPVAFHVDYWDGPGWQDRFATPAFSARQRRHVGHGLVRQVYTPGFVVAGHEWRGWFGGETLAPAAPAAGVLHATLDGQRLDVRYTPHGSADGALQARVAVLGFGLGSEVRAGENAGRRLRHDFVVLGFDGFALHPDGSGHWTGQGTLPAAQLPAPRHALAVWIERNGEPAPLQATGGWLALPAAGP
ncbi:MAG TPA: DUF1223 domain-containing protein [Plasticicumulans sp.]|nr:DUF1223 domain-containing protein [Plasticicumulans sp.]